MPSQTTPAELPTTSANLKVSGTKSFFADVSENGRTNLSQGLALTLAGDIGQWGSCQREFFGSWSARQPDGHQTFFGTGQCVS